MACTCPICGKEFRFLCSLREHLGVAKAGVGKESCTLEFKERGGCVYCLLLPDLELWQHDGNRHSARCAICVEAASSIGAGSFLGKRVQASVRPWVPSSRVVALDCEMVGVGRGLSVFDFVESVLMYV